MNCEYCGAPAMFKKGDRVALNGEWRPYGNRGYAVGAKATVIGQSRSLGCVRLLFDARKTITTFHQSFLRRIK